VDLSPVRSAIEQQAALMVAVATGGPQINTVQQEYTERRDEVQQDLQRLGLDDPNPFRDLWAWYGYYSQNLPRWHERRTYISELYEPLYVQLDGLAEQGIGTRLDEEDRTGWERVDDQIVQLRQRYLVALTVEDFQAIGLLCRDVFVSLAEAIFEPDRHSRAGEEPPTALRDQLFAVIEHEAPGAANRELRALLKASIDYANKVQHDRAATRDQARVVAEATIAAINVIRAVTVVEQGTDLAAMREAWTQTVLPAVAQRSAPLAVVLREARPVAFGGDSLILGFPPAASFHRSLAEDPRNATVLEEVLREVIGQAVPIEFVEIDDDGAA
jgi:hypothetical protein